MTYRSIKKLLFVLSFGVSLLGPLAMKAHAYIIITDHDGMPIRIIQNGNPYPQVMTQEDYDAMMRGKKARPN